MSNYRIEYGDSKIEGGLFLRQKPSSTASLDYTDGEGECFKHLSTFSQRSTIKEQLIEMLDNAKRYIFFTSFMIQDKQLVEHLIAASRRLKGHVYVLTTLKDHDFNTLIAQQDDAGDDQWNFKEHIDCIEDLVRHGISVKARRDCHAKFAVSDDKQVIVTSANAVPTCFEKIQQKSGHLRDANPENGVLIEIPSEVNRIANFFRAIWRNAHNYYVSPNSQLIDIREINKNFIPIRCKEPRLTSDLGKIIWTAPDDLRILNEISSMIDTAKQKITISSYLIKGIETHVLGQKISQAVKRGVEIEILLRQMYRSDHQKSCYYLKTLGEQVQIRGDFCNHSKSVLVDNNKAMIMSANIDAQHGLDSSVEVGFVSSHPDFIRCVGGFLNRLKAGCTLEFVVNPTQHQAAQGFPTFSKTIIKNEMSLHFDPKLKHRERIIKKLISEMSHQLMRVSHVEKNKSEKVTLLTESLKINCIQGGEGKYHVQHVVETPAAQGMRFQYLLPRMIIEIHSA